MNKPRHLREKDTVAIVSQSSGIPFKLPHIYENGLRNMQEAFGLGFKEYPTTRAEPDYLYEHPEKRAQDINDAFEDQDVVAIFSSIGGEDSIRILPYLDIERIEKSPKVILGFSDAHTVLAYLSSQTDLVTFAGPCVMAGFSQMREFPPSFGEHVKDVLFRNLDSYEYKPFPFYSEGYPDWSNVENTGKLNPKKANTGWKWLQLGSSSKVRGRLFGGCMEVLEFMKGTRFWPNSKFWDGKILFLETSEVKPSPDFVRWWLRNYGSQGIIDRISGILIGKPVYYSEKEKEALEESIVDVVKKEFGRSDMPIVFDMEIGHTDPRFIIPLGIEAEIDSDRRSFRLVESSTK